MSRQRICHSLDVQRCVSLVLKELLKTSAIRRCLLLCAHVQWDTLENSRVDLSRLGLMLVEGDVAVRVADWLSVDSGGSSAPDEQQQQRKGTPYIWRRWPLRTVYYDFHSCE